MDKSGGRWRTVRGRGLRGAVARCLDLQLTGRLAREGSRWLGSTVKARTIARATEVEAWERAVVASMAAVEGAAAGDLHCSEEGETGRATSGGSFATGLRRESSSAFG